MRRVLLVVLTTATALAVTPADAKTCAGTRTIEGWSGACVGGRTWVACVRWATMYPAAELYVPGPGSGGDPCRPS